MSDSRVALFRKFSEHTSAEDVAKVIFLGDQITQQGYVHYCRTHGWL